MNTPSGASGEREKGMGQKVEVMAARRRDVRRWMQHNVDSYSTATELAEAAGVVFRLPDGGLDNETHWVWDEALEAFEAARGGES